MKGELEGNVDDLDGFDEIEEVDQDRVATALANGHVAPEDKTTYTEEEEARIAMNGGDRESLREEAKAKKEEEKARIARG